MQLSALLPVLALLATPALSAHNRQQRDHARALAQFEKNVERRAALAENLPRALDERPRRVVQKRGATGCRARTTTTSNSTSATSTSTSASSTSVATSAAATTSAPASSTDNGNWGNPSSAAAPSSASSAAPAASSAAAPTNSGGGSASGLTPNGIKAGASNADVLGAFGNHISWYYTWDPTPPNWGSSTSATFVSMLWGNGHTGGQDASRLATFESMSYSPAYIMGAYEPDCYAPMSSDLDAGTVAWLWNTYIAPHRASGSVLISPGMCKQADEDMIPSIISAVGNNMWDVTALHINKLDMDGVRADLDHYAKYGKPLWVTEFACVDDQNGFTPCSDQSQIDSFIYQIVDLLENDSRVAAYAKSDGEGLGSVWPSWSNGALSASGQTYLNAISKYH